MRTVKLLGELGKKFGKQFKLDVKNPAEAVRALIANFPELEKHLMESEKRGIGYRVLVGKNIQQVEDLNNPSGKQVIKFVPVVMGSKSGGMFGVIVGAVLITAGVVGNIMYPGNPVSPYLINAGVAMVIGGVIQMLAPVPKAPKDEDRPDNKPSYVFNGAVNTTAQGYPVPVGYGRMIVGSAVISAGIVAEELPI